MRADISGIGAGETGEDRVLDDKVKTAGRRKSKSVYGLAMAGMTGGK